MLKVRCRMGNSTLFTHFCLFLCVFLRLEVGEDGLFVRTQRVMGDPYLLTRVYNAAGAEDPDRLQSLLSRHRGGPERSGRGRGGHSRGRERHDRVGSNFVPVSSNKRKVGCRCNRTNVVIFLYQTWSVMCYLLACDIPLT